LRTIHAWTRTPLRFASARTLASGSNPWVAARARRTRLEIGDVVGVGAAAHLHEQVLNPWSCAVFTSAVMLAGLVSDERVTQSARISGLSGVFRLPPPAVHLRPDPQPEHPTPEPRQDDPA
jgi:hypothetical protein